MSLLEITGDDGQPLFAVVLAEAEALDARVKDGFSPTVMLAIYPSTHPCIGLCFGYRDKHMHVFTYVKTAEETLNALRSATRNPESLNILCERVLQQAFDPIPETHRVMMEVTSQPDHRDVN